MTDETLNLKIDWLRNGDPIDIDVDPRFIQTSDYSLIISKTSELDSGTYTCVARTELDEARAQATLIVQDVPNSPKLIGVQCNARNATVQWKAMGDNRAAIQRFDIQYNTSFTPDTWDIMADHIPASDNSYTVDLSPYANYTFRVKAWNKIGNLLSSYR